MEGKVAIVTGASGGIGAAVARQLAGEGVAGLASRSGADLGLDDAARAPCDVRDPAQVDALAEATVDRFGAARHRSSRTPASAPTGRSWSSRPSSSTR